jgi:hypothetical protein
MSIVMTTHIPGATTELYDSLTAEMGVSPDNLPKGLVAHYAAPSDGGMLIFDVWESKDDFEDFAAGTLAPAMEKVTGGAGAGVQPTVAELHNELHR